jgi:hypothetical protein
MPSAVAVRVPEQRSAQRQSVCRHTLWVIDNNTYVSPESET